MKQGWMVREHLGNDEVGSFGHDWEIVSMKPNGSGARDGMSAIPDVEEPTSRRLVGAHDGRSADFRCAFEADVVMASDDDAVWFRFIRAE
jgi:hypothetical protein